MQSDCHQAEISERKFSFTLVYDVSVPVRVFSLSYTGRARGVRCVMIHGLRKHGPVHSLKVKRHRVGEFCCLLEFPGISSAKMVTESLLCIPVIEILAGNCDYIQEAKA